jgi:pimeloyl-ACP methyl ester carboxylesterase
MTLPALLIVPGAWHKPDHFDLLVEELPDVDVHVVTLTSTGDDPATLRDMHADADVIAHAAAAVDRPLVVLAHSYGGVPTTQALSKATNVRHIVYLTAFQLDAGEALLTPNGGRLMPWARLHQGDGVGDYVEATNPATVFYNDLDSTTAERATSRLGYQSLASMRQQLTETAWKTIPSTYVVCDADNAIPVAAQEMMARRAGDVHRLNASHSPFLSQPAAVADLVRRALTSAPDAPSVLPS